MRNRPFHDGFLRALILMLAVPILSSLRGCPAAASAAGPKLERMNFKDGELNGAPPGFSSFPPDDMGKVWAVRDISEIPGPAKVLVHVGARGTDIRPHLLVHDDFSAENLRLSVRFKIVSGEIDQAVGIVARFKDPENFLLIHLSASENRVRLFSVSKDGRGPFAETGAPIALGRWNDVAVDLKGARAEIRLNGKTVLNDGRVPLSGSGRVGFWAMVDNDVYLDDFEMKKL